MRGFEKRTSCMKQKFSNLNPNQELRSPNLPMVTGTFGPLAVAGRVLKKWISQSFLPSFHLSRPFLGMILFFCKFQNGARDPYEVVCNSQIFWKNLFCPQNWKNGPKMGQKQGFLEFIEKFDHQFLLNLFNNENFYYMLCSCTNPMFEKIFVPEIWAKMFSANQIAQFFNQP